MPLDSESRSKVKKFFNTLEDQPLEPTNPYYLAFLEESDTDPIAELSNRISFSVSESVNLFSGQAGCGKSTEFRRLKRDLEADGCVVFLLNMREYMNLCTTVEISDFLISIMTALSNQVEERFGKAPFHRSYLECLGDFLTAEVNLENMKIKAGSADINASLKGDPIFKQRLQEGLKGHTAKIVKDAHRFCQDTVSFIRKKSKDNDKKVVLLVDSVEQIRGIGIDGSVEVHQSVQNLFLGHVTSLQIPMLHIVYTIPPYLPALVPGLGRQLGGAMLCTLPSIHVKNKDNTIDQMGLDIMQEVITKRYPQWRIFFNPEQINCLAIASGGDLRDFFRLLRAALAKTKTQPVTDAVIEQSLNHLRREMMPIASDDKKWLQDISHNKDVNLETITQQPNLARFFDTKLVLNYRDGDDWYDIHPLLKDEINH